MLIPINSIVYIRRTEKDRYRIVIYNPEITTDGPRYLYKNEEKHIYKSIREAIGIIKMLYNVTKNKNKSKFIPDGISYTVRGYKECILSETCTEDSKIISKLSIF